MQTSGEAPRRRVKTDEQPIRDLMAERASAMRRGDADAIVALYAPEIVKFDLAPPLRQSAESVRDAAALQRWFEGHGGAVDYEIRDLEVVVEGDHAYCHALHRMGEPQADPSPSGGEGFTLWFRVTTVLRRIGNAWRIVHEHESTPFHMDGTFRAAVDLEP